MNQLAMSDRRADAPAGIAAAIRKSLDEIVRDWSASASDAVGAPADVNPSEFLKRLAERLEYPRTTSATTPVTVRIPSASALVLSLAGLRQAVLRYISLQRVIAPADLAEFDRAFDESMAEALASAVDSHLHDLHVGDELQARYMSFLSHELRGSLNGLVLMLEVMRRELSPHPEFAETTQDIELMRKSVQETVHNMERYVQVERLRQHKIPVHMQAVKLRPIVSRIVDELASLAREKQAELLVEVDEGLLAQADPELVRVALLNLVDNAIRHGKSPIEIASSMAADGCMVSVTDRGSGIAPDRLERLLDPARRAQLKEKGIGLTLTSFAAQNIGGRIDAESALGGPTTFRLILAPGKVT